MSSICWSLSSYHASSLSTATWYALVDVTSKQVINEFVHLGILMSLTRVSESMLQVCNIISIKAIVYIIVCSLHRCHLLTVHAFLFITCTLNIIMHLVQSIHHHHYVHGVFIINIVCMVCIIYQYRVYVIIITVHRNASSLWLCIKIVHRSLNLPL